MKDRREFYLSILLMIIILIGTLGNILNLIVFAQKSMRKMPTFRLLLYLSAIDLIILLVCANDLLFTFSFEIQVRLYSSFTCRFHTFLTNFFTQLSSVILTVVSIERAFVIYNKKVKFFELNHIQNLVIAIMTVVAIINIHYIIFFELNSENDEKFFEFMANNSAVPNRLDNVLNYLKSSKLLPKRVTHLVNIESFEPNVTYEISVYVCYPISNRIYNYFFIHIWTWIDSLIYSFIPIATMTVCSAMIIMEVSKKSLKPRSLFDGNKNLIERRNRRKNQILFLLISTNIFFILCSLPYCLAHFSSAFDHNELEKTHRFYMCHIVAYANNAFNFVFYIFYSEKYRQELKNLFKNINLITIPIDIKSIFLIKTFKANSIVIKNKRNNTNNKKSKGDILFQSIRQFSKEPRIIYRSQYNDSEKNSLDQITLHFLDDCNSNDVL